MRPDRRLLIVGDSGTLGITELRGKDIVSSTRPTYVDYLREFFKNYEIIANADIHRKTGDVLPILGSLIESSKPDLVMLALGGNDADLDWKRFIISRGRIVRTQLPVESFKNNLLKLIRIIREQRAEPILTLFTSHCLSIRGEYLSRLCGMDITGWIARGGGDVVSERMLQEYWRTIDKIAAQQNIQLVRHGPALRAADPSVVLAPDGTHPNADGHRLIAREMIATLARSEKEIDVLAAS